MQETSEMNMEGGLGKIAMISLICMRLILLSVICSLRCNEIFDCTTAAMNILQKLF